MIRAGHPRTSRLLLRHGLVLALFGVLAAVYARPLFDHVSTRIASDPYDPILNASILWWNATVPPFTEHWWSQPWYYPSSGITAFTETLVGLAPLSSPIYWLTGSTIATYNLVFFLSWPLTAFAAYLLVDRLTARTDAAILGGLAFGFSPYRTAELGHLQSLCVFGLPIALAALHAYLDTRRRRWLVLFGTAWVLQSLTNGYYLLFGAVLIGLWVAWFCSSPQGRTAAPAVLAACVFSSLPLVPVLWRYKTIHDYYGLRRQYFEALAFSAHPASWFQVSDYVRAWAGRLPQGSDDLFPGITVLMLTLLAILLAAARRPAAPEPSSGRRVAKRVLVVIVLLSASALGRMLAVGPWSIERGTTVWFKMNDPFRALGLLAVCGPALVVLSRRLRRAVAERHPLVFHAGAALVMAVLACGPVLSVHDHSILDPAPYRWLMMLPGFDQVRVPSRFWMLGVLSLSTTGALGFALITARWKPVFARAAFIACAAGLVADGWLTAMPTEAAPATWTSLEDRAADAPPILSLPFGPDWDAAATFGTTVHHRRVVNGVSGYDPPHYAPLREGLRMQDPEMLAALASLGPYDIVINPAIDVDGGWARYASGAPGAVRQPNRDGLTVLRVPGTRRAEVRVGSALPIVRVTSSRGDPSPVFDHRLDTDWVDYPQNKDQWLLAELDGPRAVGGVSLAIEEHAGDYPVHLKVELSQDGEQWSEAWDGPTSARVFLAAERDPRTGWLRIAFPPGTVRYVRVRQTRDGTTGWRVPELEVNAPAD